MKVRFAPQALDLEPEKTARRRDLVVSLWEQRDTQERLGLWFSLLIVNLRGLQIPG